MKRIAQTISWLALTGALLPACLYFADQVDLNHAKAWMLAATVVWFIATPLWTNADIAVACVQAGKHVLCEKPMAKDGPSAKRMLAASHQHKRVL
mgnify:CR=1 FL=1